MISAISDAGVIGYPAKKRQPLANAPSAQATSPLKKCSPHSIPGLFAAISRVLHLFYRFILRNENGELRADQLTQPAGGAVVRRDDVRRMVTLQVETLGAGKHVAWTELHAELAALAAVVLDVDRPACARNLVPVKRNAPESLRDRDRHGGGAPPPRSPPAGP